MKEWRWRWSECAKQKQANKQTNRRKGRKKRENEINESLLCDDRFVVFAVHVHDAIVLLNKVMLDTFAFFFYWACILFGGAVAAAAAAACTWAHWKFALFFLLFFSAGMSSRTNAIVSFVKGRRHLVLYLRHNCNCGQIRWKYKLTFYWVIGLYAKPNWRKKPHAVFQLQLWLNAECWTFMNGIFHLPFA